MRILVLLSFLITPFRLWSQCIVEAGEDQAICMYSDTFPNLKGQIIQGDSIVSIKWEALTQDEDVFFFASDMLSDTSVLNPEFHSHYKPTVKLFLTATDASGQSCSDSVTYRFSDWVFLAVDKAAIKNASDTISLWPAGGSNFPIVKYEWLPDYNISDVNSPTPEVWNDTSTTYRLFMTDSIGCTVEDDPFEVYIRTTSEQSLDISPEPLFFPNPVRSSLYLSHVEKWTQLFISDSRGSLVKVIYPTAEIQMNDLPIGTYLLTFIGKKGQRITRKIIKQ